MKEMWRETKSEPTRAIPVHGAGPATAASGDPARAAWIRVMAQKRELDEEQAAHLWDANIPLIPKGVFEEGFRSRDVEIEERERAASAVADELKAAGQRMEALLAEITERSGRVERLEAELEKHRTLSRAVAALATAAGDEEVTADSDRLTQIAFSALTDLSLALSGEKERQYPSRPVYIRAAAVFKKLYDQGATGEFVTLYQDLSSLLREMEPYLYAAQQASLEGEASGPGAGEAAARSADRG